MGKNRTDRVSIAIRQAERDEAEAIGSVYAATGYFKDRDAVRDGLRAHFKLSRASFYRRLALYDRMVAERGIAQMNVLLDRRTESKENVSMAKTLLEQAMELEQPKKSARKVTSEEIDLAVAWALGKVETGRAVAVFSKPRGLKSKGTALTHFSYVVKEAVQQGRLVAKE